VRLTARNTGNVTWPVGAGSPVRLGTSSPRDRASSFIGPTWSSASRADRVTADGPVTPGAVGTFDLVLSGGGRPVGVTTEAFEPLWEAKHWIDGDLTTFTVVRVDPAVSRLASLDRGPAAAVRTTTTAAGITLVVRLRNLGGSSWTVGKEWLATASGKGDPLRTSAWPYPTRPPAMAGNVTAPGQQSVRPGEIGEWRIPLSGLRRTPGTYSEAWQALGAAGRYGPVVRTTVTVARG
jgi:hypothetical protein